jgi:hypothetical protein
VPRIFISYSHEDARFADRLRIDLEDRGATVWVDEKEILPGQSISHEIENSLASSDAVLFCLSETSVARPWVQREFRAALTLQLATSDSRPRVIPVLIEPCELPVLLRDIKVADFSSEYQHGLAALLRALDLARIYPKPYAELIRHIEQRQPLETFFVQNLRLPHDWLFRLFELLEAGVAQTAEELREMLGRGERPVVILSDPIHVHGSYELLTDSVDPVVGVDRGFLEFGGHLARCRTAILERQIYLLPRGLTHEVDIYPDRDESWSVPVEDVVRRLESTPSTSSATGRDTSPRVLPRSARR